MADSSKSPKNVAQADTSRIIHSTDSPSGETARAADSVPIVVGPFTDLPMRFGRYEIRKELGRGQMGAVYLAEDTELDRPVAIKVARTSLSGSGKLLKRMEVEAKAAAKIDHPHICKVYDAGEIDGIRFIAMQYIEGEDLKQFMKRLGRKRTPDEAVRLVLQILRALSAAHDKGVVHRDLKPENVMLNSMQQPVIMDFGLARRSVDSTDASLTQGMIVGTAAYMPPEQASGNADDVDQRSDIYAIGVMFFEMLTGEWPFTGGGIEVMGKKCVKDPPIPLKKAPELPPELSAVCFKMIQRRKEHRYATCVEVITALESIDQHSLNCTSTRKSAIEPELDLSFLDELDSGPAFPEMREKVRKKKKRVSPKTSDHSGLSTNETTPCVVSKMNKPSAFYRRHLVGFGLLIIAIAAILAFEWVAPITSKPGAHRIETPKQTNNSSKKQAKVAERNQIISRPQAQSIPNIEPLKEASRAIGDQNPLNIPKNAPGNNKQDPAYFAEYIRAMNNPPDYQAPRFKVGNSPPTASQEGLKVSGSTSPASEPVPVLKQISQQNQIKLQSIYPPSKLQWLKTHRFEKEKPFKELNQSYVEKGVLGIQSNSGVFAWNFADLTVNQMIRTKLRVRNQPTGRVGICLTQKGNSNGVMIQITGDQRVLLSPSIFAKEKPASFHRAYDAPDIVKPCEEWNDLACALKGNSVTVFINNVQIDSVDMTTGRSTPVLLAFSIGASSEGTLVEMEDYRIYNVK